MPINPRTGTDAYYQPGYSYAQSTPPGMPLSPPSVGAQQPTAPPGAAPNPTGGSTVSVNPNNPLAAPPPLGTNPNPVMTPPGPPASTQPSTGGAAGGQTLYDWSNPTQAMVNTMRSSGMAINPLNATFQLLMRAAPGLANAFLLQGAAANDQSPDQYGNFSGFIRNALTQGNVPTVLRNAEGNLASMIPQARAYLSADQSGSPNPLAGNTLLGALASVLGQNNGAGVMDVLSNLHTPMMNRQTSSAYQNLLAGPTGLGSQANFQYGQGLQGGDTARDFWYYLLGR